MGLVVMSALVAQSYPGKATRPQGLTRSRFSFTAAGDYGQTSATTANLKYIAHSGARFNLGLGDFNYDPSHVSAAKWSAYVHSYLPANFPFEIVAGDHDKSQISSLVVDLPDYMANTSGTYGREYSFDYPSTVPLARFIMISPGVRKGNYNQGGADYNWVSQQIDAARTANIHWVIVGMAEGCLFINSPSNSTPCSTPDLLNLLVSKKVDLILQAHQHGYEAGKQLALNSTTCPTINTTAYDASCVVNASSMMTKGAGAVLLITGAGGQSLVNLDTTDPKTGYFRTWMGSNINPTFGVAHITISPTQLGEQFVAVSGSFSDSFTIYG